MKKVVGLAALLGTAAAALSWAAAGAAQDAFAVSDAQLARLGVTLGAAEPVELVEVAAAPAEVVVPPARQALVSAPQAGVVARLLVAEGDAVERGQPVAEIDSAEFLDRQRDYLDAAAAHELAAAQEARDRGLFEEGIIAERRLAEAAAEARATRAKLDQARAQLALAGFTDADLARLAARRELATRMVLRAPFAGVVAAAHADVGARVDALDPVLAVADLSELWLELRLSEAAAARVRPGMLAAVAVGGETVTSAITTVGRVVDPMSQTVLVRASVSDPGALLRAGQMLTAHVLAQSDAKAYAVPSAAVTRVGGEVLVFVRSGPSVTAQPIEVLADDGARVYVVSGIDAGTLVAVDGISALKALWLADQEEGG
jgi:cobalt-zinc-cadmium efflux system membrane fusion protein